MLQVTTRSIVIVACLCARTIGGFGLSDDLPRIEARVSAVSYCAERLAHSVRVHITLNAHNSSDRTVVVPRVAAFQNGWIGRANPWSNARRLEDRKRPEASRAVWKILEADGGWVVKLGPGEQATLHGLDLAFLIDAREAGKLAVHHRVLELGTRYEIRGDAVFWQRGEAGVWIARGYETRLRVPVSATFDVPAQPVWDSCPNEPPIIKR